MKWYLDIECPECGSDRVFDNGHNEKVCNDCGEAFYLSDQDEIDEGIRYENVGTSFYIEDADGRAQ